MGTPQDPYVMAHAAPSPEAPQLATGKVRSLLKRMLYNGLNMPVRFLQSLRVGSGTGLAGVDGSDGAVIADGAAAAFVMGDQGNPNANQWARWRYQSPTVYLDSWYGPAMVQHNTQLFAAVMKNSLRVGTGTGMAGFDGLDGAVVASGVQAAYFFGDRTTPATGSYGALYSASNAHRLFDSTNGDVYTYTRATKVHNLLGPVTGTSSIRVGSGSGTLAAFDGQDGVVLADGTQGGFFFRDRTTTTSYGAWAALSNLIVLAYQAGNVWIISPSSGLIAQDALTAITPAANVSVLGAPWLPSGSRIVKPTGQVYVSIQLVVTANIPAGSVLATISGSHRPTGNAPVAIRYTSNLAGSGYLNASSQFICDQAVANGIGVTAVVNYYQ